MQATISQGLGKGEGALAGSDGPLMVAYKPKMLARKCRDSSQSVLIAQGLGEDFGLVQDIPRPLEFSQRKEHRAQVKADIDGLLAGAATFRQILQGSQCLLKGCHRLSVG